MTNSDIILLTKNNKKIIKSWDETWEKVFSSQEWGKYPPEELIRFTARNFYNVDDRKKIKFLDLGCGTGACSWYLAKEGFSVYGIDGSKTAISLAKKRFKIEKLVGKFQVMDYINLQFPDNYFDAVIDIASIETNPIQNVPIILGEIKRVLKPNGKLFSMMVSKGTFYEPFKNKGHVHFYNLPEVKKLFKLFKSFSVERSERTENNMKDKIIHWVITCKG